MLYTTRRMNGRIPRQSGEPLPRTGRPKESRNVAHASGWSGPIMEMTVPAVYRGVVRALRPLIEKPLTDTVYRQVVQRRRDLPSTRRAYVGLGHAAPVLAVLGLPSIHKYLNEIADLVQRGPKPKVLSQIEELALAQRRPKLEE